MGYTFIKADNVTKIIHTDGREWILMDSPTIYCEGDSYFIDDENLHITFRSFEIDSIDGLSPDTVGDHLIAQINAVLPIAGDNQPDDATSANQGSEITLLTSISNKLNTVSADRIPIDISGQSVAVNNLPTTQPVSGSVSVSNFPSTQNVSVSNLPSTQPISGSVSINNLPSSQVVSGSVNVGNFPNTQPVSGSVSISNLPGTQPISGSVSVSNLPSTAAMSDTQANPTVQSVAGDMMRFNGSTWDRYRNNYSETVLVSTTTGTSGNSSAMINYNSRGAMFFVNITSISGTLASITVQLQGQDPVSGGWANISGAATSALGAIGLNLLTIGSGLSLIANNQVNVSIPRNYRISYSVAGIGASVTFSVGVQYIS